MSEITNVQITLYGNYFITEFSGFVEDFHLEATSDKCLPKENALIQSLYIDFPTSDIRIQTGPPETLEANPHVIVLHTL